MSKRAVDTVLALFVAAFVLAVVALGGLRIATRIVHGPGRPDCSAAEKAFAGKLAKDAMVNQAPTGMEMVWTVHAQPCVSIYDSVWTGGAITAWGYPPGPRPSVETIIRFYRELAMQQGWRMVREAGTVGQVDHVGQWLKTVEDTTVMFYLEASMNDGRDVYLAAIEYDVIGK